MNRTQDQINKLRALRAGFLDVAIEIEIDIRLMLVEYFVADEKRRALFEEVYESQQGTLGRLVERFNKVLTEERERLTSAGVDINALKSELNELVKNRNAFAHHPMDQYALIDEKTGDLTPEMRIAKRHGPNDTFFTVATAEKAYKSAQHCEQLILEVRFRFGKLPRE